MKIFIGADHRGYELAKKIYSELSKENYEVEFSQVATSAEDDYPDFAFDVCQNVIKDSQSIGILLCGNGIGISIAANKVKGIRCARVNNEEDAHDAKNHNGANIIAFGGIKLEDAMKIIKTFLKTELPTEQRHIRRIKKIINYENGAYNEL